MVLINNENMKYFLFSWHIDRLEETIFNVSLSINFLPVMARLTSLAASSRASIDACSLYQDVCGVQIRLGASFRGPVEKLLGWKKTKKTKTK